MQEKMPINVIHGYDKVQYSRVKSQELVSFKTEMFCLDLRFIASKVHVP